MTTVALTVHGPPRFLQQLNTSINTVRAELIKLGLINDALTPEERLLASIFGTASPAEELISGMVLMAMNDKVISVNGERVAVRLIANPHDVFSVYVTWDNSLGKELTALLDFRDKRAKRRVKLLNS